ncbi:MAG: hypothetical protein O3A84_08225 [Proteobacteria bacterium]|nr:hypothetical protein [Pseudomonadota bacterium]
MNSKSLIFGILFSLLIGLPGLGNAQTPMLPVIPCTGDVHPAYSAPGAPLNIHIVAGDALPDGWTGWKAGPAAIILAAAGRFRHTGDSALLAQRIAHISELKEVIYWSDSRDVWRRLFSDAWALTGPKKSLRRADFSDDDVQTGKTIHYYNEENNLVRGVVYQARVRERTDDRIVFESTNVTPLGLAIFDAVDSGAFQQLYYLERESSEIWRYYTLVRITEASLLARLSPKSFKNRAVAYYRFLAGIKMDKEPPAAR